MENKKRLIDENLANADSSETAKIKTHFAKIIAEGTAENPYYSILYYDPTAKEYFNGYSSYWIENVFGWLAEYFEIVEAATVSDVEVVHARWKDGDCTACGFDIRDMIDGESEFRNWVWEGLPYCPNCGAKMDGDGNG